MQKLLDLEQFNSALADRIQIKLLGSVGSTNQWVMDKVRAGAELPLACFAEEQTRGRGRRGRNWVSAPGESISMSFAWRFMLPAQRIGSLSMAMGMAVIQALEKAGIGNAMLKWPNDVLVDGRKIAGILIELSGVTETGVTAVVGIGLNYHLPDTLAEVPDQPWTDVLSELPIDGLVERNRLAIDLLDNCVMICQSYPQNMDELMAVFRDIYDACKDRAVIVMLGNGEQLEGVACGVTDEGEIRVRIKGEERMFNSAEISLRSRPVTTLESC